MATSAPKVEYAYYNWRGTECAFTCRPRRDQYGDMEDIVRHMYIDAGSNFTKLKVVVFDDKCRLHEKDVNVGTFKPDGVNQLALTNLYTALAKFNILYNVETHKFEYICQRAPDE
tara:strand:- start:119 stop:463 length:345 start_codon:yes stop_codon:yes gene_type:complete